MSNGNEKIIEDKQNLQISGGTLYDTSGGQGNAIKIGTAGNYGKPIYERESRKDGKFAGYNQIFEFQSEGGGSSFYEFQNPNLDRRSSRQTGMMEFLATAGSGFDPDVMKSRGFTKMDFTEEELGKIESMGPGMIGRNEMHYSSNRAPEYFETEEFRKKHPIPGTAWKGDRGWVEFKGDYPGPDILKGRPVSERIMDFLKGQGD